MKFSSLIKDYVLSTSGSLNILVPIHQSPKFVINLNETGVAIWKMAMLGLKDSEIAETLAKHFNIPITNVIEDIESFKSDTFLKKNAIELSQISLKLSAENVAPFRKATLELTGKCNLNCIHCYAVGKRVLKDLSTKRVLALIDEMKNAGTLFVILTGGEIFTRKDFVEIYKYLRQKGMIVTMITNASMLNDEILQVLVDYPPSHIKVSLYGSSPEIHDQITRVPGSFNLTISAVNRMTAVGIRVLFNVIVFKKTISDAGNIKKLADSLGVTALFYSSLIPTLEKDKAVLLLQANKNSLKQISKFNAEARKQVNDQPVAFKQVSNKEMYPCNVGTVNYAITSDGALVLCVNDNNKSISIKNKSLMEGLTKLRLDRHNRLRIPKGCKDCPIVYNLHC